MIEVTLSLFVHVREKETDALSPLSSFSYDKQLIVSESGQKGLYSSFIYQATDYRVPESLSQVASSYGLELSGFKEVNEDKVLKTVPLVEVGAFYQNDDTINIFSDFSNTTVVLLAHEADSIFTTPLDGKPNRISVSNYQRLADGRVKPFETWKVIYDMEEFTGALDYDTHTRAPPVVSDLLVPENLDRSVRECFVDFSNEEVVFNSNTYLQVGTFTDGETSDEVEGLWELLGTARAGGTYFSRYLPFTESVFVCDVAAGIVRDYTQVDDISFEDDSLLCFEVNRELGIVKIGGATYSDYYLKYDITNSETKITLSEYPSSDLLPDKGIVTIGTEKIKFLARDGSTLINCIRGFDSTTAAIHSETDTVLVSQQGAAPEGSVYASYRVTSRIDYETTAHQLRSCNTNSWLDVLNPRDVLPVGLLQVRTHTGQATELELTAELPVISTNLYGPMSFGDTPILITARAINSAGIPIDNVPILIQIDQGTGYLNNSDSFENISNQDGKVFSLFSNPFNESRVEIIGEEFLVDVGVTSMIFPGLTGNESLDDFIVFQILKHDNVLGTVGVSSEILGEPVETTGLATRHGAWYIDLDIAINSDFFHYGTLRVLDSLAVSHDISISFTQLIRASDDSVRFRVFYNTELVLGLATLTGEVARLFTPRDIEFDGSAMNGTRVLLYENNAGTYEAVHPDSIGPDILYFNKVLPTPSSTADENNVAGYSIVFPQKTSISASISDLNTNSFVQSDTIYIKMVLPEYLNSIDGSELIEWTIAQDQASGIGGNNFIAINPRAIVTPRLALKLS